MAKKTECHCDGSGRWSNPFDEEFECGCGASRKLEKKLRANARRYMMSREFLVFTRAEVAAKYGADGDREFGKMLRHGKLRRVARGRYCYKRSD